MLCLACFHSSNICMNSIPHFSFFKHIFRLDGASYHFSLCLFIRHKYIQSILTHCVHMSLFLSLDYLQKLKQVFLIASLFLFLFFVICVNIVLLRWLNAVFSAGSSPFLWVYWRQLENEWTSEGLCCVLTYKDYIVIDRLWFELPVWVLLLAVCPVSLCVNSATPAAISLDQGPDREGKLIPNALARSACELGKQGGCLRLFWCFKKQFIIQVVSYIM